MSSDEPVQPKKSITFEELQASGDFPDAATKPANTNAAGRPKRTSRAPSAAPAPTPAAGKQTGSGVKQPVHRSWFGAPTFSASSISGKPVQPHSNMLIIAAAVICFSLLMGFFVGIAFEKERAEDISPVNSSSRTNSGTNGPRRYRRTLDGQSQTQPDGTPGNGSSNGSPSTNPDDDGTSI